METEFISAVQACSALYDKTEPNYSNRIFVNTKWEEIGKKFDLDGAAARKKWTRLRDYFQRNRKQATTFKSGSAAKTMKKWYLYDAMTFLVPFMADRPTTSNLSDLSGSSDDDLSQAKTPAAMSCISEDLENADLESQISLPDIDMPLTQQPEKSSSRGRKRQFPFPQERRPRSRPSQFDIEVVKAIKDLESKCSSTDSINQPQSTFDEDEHYCLSLVTKMKMLEPIEKMKCQMEIHDVIVKYLMASQRPSEPGPYQPGPTSQKPSEPGPYQPGPTSQRPSEPGPYQPGPTSQRPSETGPYQPGPSQSRPCQQSPVEQAVQNANHYDQYQTSDGTYRY